jgi:transposase-like protein
MQILHPFDGSINQYAEAISTPDRNRPGHCPQCYSQQPLIGHGFYRRTVLDAAFDGVIRVRRYLCQSCERTTSLLPQFVLPYLRASIMLIAVFLLARLLHHQTLATAIQATQLAMSYQRGQFWIRRFVRHAEALCAALAALTRPAPAPDFVARALLMLEAKGWIPAHRFLFADLRCHLLGWPPSLVPDGRRATIVTSIGPV